MGSLCFSKYFMFLALDFLDFELLLSFEKYDVRIWFGYILLSCYIGVVGSGSLILSIHAFMFASHFLVVYLVCVGLCISCS